MRVDRRGYDAVFYTPLIGPLLAPTRDMPTGGAETQVYLLARALAASGRRICVVAHETSEGLPASVDGIDVVLRPPLQSRVKPGLRGRLSEIVMLLRTLRPLDTRVFVQRGTTFETGLVALAAKLKRRRFVYSTASTIDFTWGEVASRSSAVLFRLGVLLADEIVVQTQEQVELSRRHFSRTPVRIRSIGEAAERRRTRPEAFLWIGKLTPNKQPLTFVELARAVPRAQFWMVCLPSEKESKRIAREVQHAGESLPNLELSGPRPRKELMSLVERAVAIVSTSPKEGMPNVFLEGWARGVPALALAHDPDGVIAREGLGAVAQGSPGELADRAARFWDERDEQDQIAGRCRDYMRRVHDPGVIARQWLAVLEGGN